MNETLDPTHLIGNIDNLFIVRLGFDFTLCSQRIERLNHSL